MKGLGMLRLLVQLAAWAVLTAGAFVLLFGGDSGGLAQAGPWATAGVALIGLGLCVNARLTMTRS
jgi:hypothetical protein